MNDTHAILTAEPLLSASGALLGFPSCNGFCKHLNFFILLPGIFKQGSYFVPFLTQKHLSFVREPETVEAFKWFVSKRNTFQAASVGKCCFRIFSTSKIAMKIKYFIYLFILVFRERVFL